MDRDPQEMERLLNRVREQQPSLERLLDTYRERRRHYEEMRGGPGDRTPAATGRHFIV